jgi:hypothetical protein
MPNPSLNNGGSDMIQMVGNPAQLNAAFATLKLYPTDPANVPNGTLRVSVSDADSFYDPTTGYFYQVIPCTSPCTWAAAKANAATRSYHGMQAYLFSPWSAHENDFVQKLVSTDSWMGATDNASDINAACGTSKTQGSGAQGAASPSSYTEGNWYWIFGAHKCVQFARETTGGWNYGAYGSGGYTAVGGNYANWASGEPNNCCVNGENFAQYYNSSAGWNDLSATSTQNAYIAQYGGLGETTTGLSVSSASGPFQVAPSAPQQPRFYDWWAGDGTITVVLQAPTSNGGSPVTGYTVYPYQIVGRKVLKNVTCTLDNVNGVYSQFTCPAANFQKYGFVAAATNAYGTSSFANFYRDISQWVTPGFDRYIDSVDITAIRGATVNWTKPSTGSITAYKIVAAAEYGKIAGSCTVNVTDQTQQQFSCTINKLRTNNYYLFNMQVKTPSTKKMTGVNWSDNYWFDGAGTYKRPGEVSRISAHSNHDGSMDVWFNQSIGDINTYHVARAYDANGNVVSSCDMGYTNDSTLCTISGLTPGVRYKLNITGYNDATDLSLTGGQKSLSITRRA